MFLVVPSGKHGNTTSSDAGEQEKNEFMLKPMNCPGHCLVFGHKSRSYRDLPLRLAGVRSRFHFYMCQILACCTETKPTEH